MYDVLKPFRDSHDRNRNYRKDDSYPREGLEVGELRLQTLQKLGYVSERKNVELIEESDYPTEKWTKPDIQNFLNDAGLEYDESMTKKELIELLGE